MGGVARGLAGGGMKHALVLHTSVLLAPLNGLLAADNTKVNILHIQTDDHRTDGLHALGVSLL